MKWLILRIRQWFADRELQRNIRRQGEKIRVIDQQEIEDDVRDAAKTKVLHERAKSLEHYIEGD